MYKAVIFDLGRTLIDFDFQPGYRALEPFCACPAAEMSSRVMGAGLAERFETGQLGRDEFFREFSQALGLRLDYAAFVPIWNGIFKDPLIPERMLEGLRTRYQLVLLSNTNILHFEGVRRDYPILRFFPDPVLSYEVRAVKPDPRIFQAAVARANCRPCECFYTDDIPSFVEAARAMGIDAEVFRGAAQLEKDLAKRGIIWE